LSSVGSKRRIAKTVGILFVAAAMLFASIYLADDFYNYGNPFTFGSPTSTTVAYPFSIYLSPQSQAANNADMRVGIFLTFQDTVIAGDVIGLNARVVIPPTAPAQLRNGTAAVAIVIPNTVTEYNDTTFGIPRDYLYGLQYVGDVNGSLIYGSTAGPGLPIIFPDQGNYHVFVGAQTYHYSTGLIEAPDTVIHVEPRSMHLTIALAREQRAFNFAFLVLAVVGGLALILQLWKGSSFDRKRHTD
jgi:hypothetical protein